MKPKIICHIFSSVDGRLLNERWTRPYDGKAPGEICGVYAEVGKELRTQAWMFGKNTLQQLYFPEVFIHAEKDETRDVTTYLGHRASERLFVVADPTGEITYTSDTVRGDNIVTILGEQVSGSYLKHLRDMGISYLFAGTDGCDLPLAMHKLRAEFGIRSLTLQGGGMINGSFLKAGLLDELSLLVYPGIDGLAGVPSIFEYLGGEEEFPASGQALELLDASVLENGVVKLHYKFHRI
ncbi:dihydrofolate reductase family protein [Odoribacter sp. AF15-53]|uniref:dihydrofolate reductase family protein n=1 Tax=Odoribacter sp. AF15-53 TaxID=2292236 RepID=UPI000E47403E|nr:dihydrofolate reductase family protein [Odoribacter sp. AF15-53]RHR77115.1 hypothetical protein DWW52_14390 [Odoribacter sp. AF15-53]